MRKKRHNPERREFKGVSHKNGKRIRELRAASHLRSHRS